MGEFQTVNIVQRIQDFMYTCPLLQNFQINIGIPYPTGYERSPESYTSPNQAWLDIVSHAVLDQQKDVNCGGIVETVKKIVSLSYLIYKNPDSYDSVAFRENVIEWVNSKSIFNESYSTIPSNIDTTGKVPLFSHIRYSDFTVAPFKYPNESLVAISADYQGIGSESPTFLYNIAIELKYRIKYERVKA